MPRRFGCSTSNDDHSDRPEIGMISPKGPLGVILEMLTKEDRKRKRKGILIENSIRAQFQTVGQSPR